MKETTYIRLVQSGILLFLMVGVLFADPAASGPVDLPRDRGVTASGR